MIDIGGESERKSWRTKISRLIYCERLKFTLDETRENDVTGR